MDVTDDGLSICVCVFFPPPNGWVSVCIEISAFQGQIGFALIFFNLLFSGTQHQFLGTTNIVNARNGIYRH